MNREQRRHGYYLNGTFRGYCSHEQFERAKKASARMKDRERKLAWILVDECNIAETIDCALTRSKVTQERTSE